MALLPLGFKPLRDLMPMTHELRVGLSGESQGGLVSASTAAASDIAPTQAICLRPTRTAFATKSQPHRPEKEGGRTFRRSFDQPSTNDLVHGRMTPDVLAHHDLVFWSTNAAVRTPPVAAKRGRRALIPLRYDGSTGQACGWTTAVGLQGEAIDSPQPP